MAVKRCLVGTVQSLILAAAVVDLGACSPAHKNTCGLSSDAPDVAAGTLQVTRDGSAYVSNTGLRGYRLANTSTDIEAGDLSLRVGKDSSGNNVGDLIGQGKFPICILLSDPADGTHYAQVRSSTKTYGTDSAHTGTVILIKKDGDDLVGRFALDALANGGAETTHLEDGAFRLGPR